MTDDAVLTPREVAAVLRVDYETVLGYMHSGLLLSRKQGGRYFIRQSAVDAFLEPDNASRVDVA